MVDTNIHRIVDVLHILPRPSKHHIITIHIMKEAVIKFNLCLQSLHLKLAKMTNEKLKYDGVLYSEYPYMS